MSKTQPFINKDDAYTAYDESRKWLRTYFDPLQEFERLARNRPSDKIDPSLPRVTDGTLAAIVQEQPKRIIQKPPVGLVHSNDHLDYAAVADVVLTNRLMPMYNRMGSLIQKSWNMVGKSMTYGMSTSYTFFTNTNGQLHTDFVIPYIKDVLCEKGKIFAPDSNIRFMRSWYQKRDLQAIIEREKTMMEGDKKYTSDWDLKALADFIQGGASAKPADTQTPAEREKGDGYTGGYEVIHAFQKGVGAELYSFSPQFEQGKPLRTKINADPRGKIPLDDLYCNIDLSNPLGRGVVELSGGVQNLIDQQMQMFQFMSTLEMGPPLQVWGNVNKASLKFRPNAIWDMGAAGTNKVEPYVVSNNMMTNFSTNYGLLKSQIMNLNSSADHSISASDGNSQQSKTQAGVQASEQRLGVSDNYLRQQYEAWFKSQSETSLNIFFSEMQGNEKIQLNSLEIDKLKSGPAVKFLSGEKLEVDYKQVKDVVFSMTVEPGSSREQDDIDQLAKMQEMMTEVNANPLVTNWFLGQSGKKLKMGELFTQRFQRMGIKNIDAILVDMDAKEAEAAKQQPFPIIDKPQIRINTADLTAEQIAAALAAGGVQSPQSQPQQGMPPGLSPQGMADFMVEMTKAQGAAGGSGPNPDELALKQQELQLKAQGQEHQQATDQAKLGLEVAKTAHQHTMDMHNADQQQQQQQMDNAMTLNSASQSAQDQQFQHEQGQAQQELAAKTAGVKSKTKSKKPVAKTTMKTETGVSAPTPQPQLHALQPEEQQTVHDLLQRGFNAQDVEQAIIMLRQGMPLEQVIQTLGAKK